MHNVFHVVSFVVAMLRHPTSPMGLFLVVDGSLGEGGREGGPEGCREKNRIFDSLCAGDERAIVLSML